MRRHIPAAFRSRGPVLGRRNGSRQMRWFKVWPLGEPEKAHRFGGEDASQAVERASRYFTLRAGQALSWEESS